MTLTVLATLASTPLLAQRTADQARLSLGIAGGATVGTDLWSFTNQPIADGANIDTVIIGRRLRSSLAIVFHGTYFPGEHLGFTGEAMLIGLGFEDECEVRVSSGSGRNADICASVNANETPASAVSLSLGSEYRIWSQKIISPYLRAHAGLVMTQHTGVALSTDFPVTDSSGTQLVLYNFYHDPKNRRITPVFGLGVGFTAALGRGYQLRWEIRDNITGIETVTGPTFGSPNVEPPHKTAYKHVFSVTFGFDVVLERRRGRRY
jgi:hypothetical protein